MNQITDQELSNLWQSIDKHDRQNPAAQGLLQRYKSWVRAHPGMIGYFDWLLYLGTWAPGRATGQQHSELYYELWHAVVGLLHLWHNNIIEEEQSPVRRPSAALWLDALQQLEVIIELRAIHVEQHGRINRYSPLLLLEVCKSLLKMRMWGKFPGHLFLRNPGPEDMDQFESEQGLDDVTCALERLRLRYVSQIQAPSVQKVWPKTLQQWLWKSNTDNTSKQPSRTESVQSTSTVSGDTPTVGPQQQQLCSTASDQCTVGRSVHHCGSSGRRGVCPPTSSSTGIASVSQHVKHVTQQSRVGMDLMWLAELLHIWRPVIYVAMLRRQGRQSWRPWVASLAVDLLSMHFTYRGKSLLRTAIDNASAQQPPLCRMMKDGGPAKQQGRAGRPAAGQRCQPRRDHVSSSLLSLALARAMHSQPWSPGEKMELAQRQRMLMYYLLRSPVYDMAIRPMMARVRDRTMRIPLLGTLADYGASLLDTYILYYTYTSAS